MSLAVYLRTLAPTVTLERSGVMAVAADYLGVGHPTGYPLWTVCGWLFQWLLHPLAYHGHPNPALATNLMSAVFGAASAATLAWLIARACVDFAHEWTDTRDTRLTRVAAFCAAFAGASLLAFHPFFWSQAVITDMVTLGTFLRLLLVACAYQWLREGSPLMPYAILFLAGACVLTGYWSILLGLWIPFVFLAAGRRLAAIRWSALGLALVAGFMPLLYFPVSSEQNPPINWGYCRTGDGFRHMISRGQYEAVSLLNPWDFPESFVRVLWKSVEVAGDSFTWPVAAAAALALIPLVRAGGMRPWLLLMLLVHEIFLLGVPAIAFPKPDVQTQWVYRTSLVPTVSFHSFFIGIGLFALLRAWSGMGRTRGESPGDRLIADPSCRPT